jgi:HAMP domain-containing protein
MEAQREKTAVDVDESLKKVEAVDQQVGGALKTGDEVAGLKRLWQQLRFDVDQLAPAQVLEAHNRLLRAFNHLNITFGNSSFLILDPDVDTYYAMGATTFKLYKLMDEVSQMRAVAAGGLLAGAGIDLGGRVALASLATRADDSLNTLNTNLEFGLDANDAFAAAARPALAEANTAIRSLLDGAAASAVAGDSGVTSEAFWTSSSRAIEASSKLHDVILGELERMLGARLVRLDGERWRGLGIAAVGMALAGLLLWLAIRSVTRPIQELRSVAERVSLGDMEARLTVADKSEIGALADSFRRMQTSLSTAMEALRVK